MAITANDVSWTLSDIRAKVRKLAGRPSTNQISDNKVDEYINRFYTQDLMALMDLQSVETYWRFETLVNVPSYSMPKEAYAIGPAYVNGNEIEVFQDPSVFYKIYAQQFVNNATTDTGDGSTQTFTGTLGSTVIHPENFVVSDGVEALKPKQRLEIDNITSANPAVITTAKAHGLSDGDKVQIVEVRNGMVEINNVISTITSASSTSFQLDNVDSSSFTSYLKGGFVLPTSVMLLEGDFGGSGRVTVGTGAYSFTFNTAPADGQAIQASYEFSNVGEPEAALFYDNELLMTPMPDRTYFVQMPIKGRPTPLLENADALAFDDLGKIVAYGAAIDILNDEGQQDTVALLEPQFRRLQSQARTRRIRNSTEQRAVPTF